MALPTKQKDSASAELAERLLRLEDERDIHGLLARLAQAWDSREIAPYMNAFVGDAVFESDGQFRNEGTAQIRAWSQERWAGASASPPLQDPVSRHLITSTVVQLDGDQAGARTYFTVVGGGAGPPAVRATAIYEDNLVRTSGGWKLKHRKVGSILG